MVASVRRWRQQSVLAVVRTWFETDISHISRHSCTGEREKRPIHQEEPKARKKGIGPGEITGTQARGSTAQAQQQVQAVRQQKRRQEREERERERRGMKDSSAAADSSRLTDRSLRQGKPSADICLVD